ncbi:Cd2+/Zn2+-exporting ATPase [Deinobacterium chartae]|uniref:Cd2+/Zn2+-exporting ATPase n=1 Tax=Deinobacterium chartae TaxID=521158 RepID=A0A841I5M7_9DEIO|nr:heavy metal translocating P-type ATPase [Deinobacterium chartae]MBB6099740.1 Cd2+/Zn2+-exporting ATPase [Deinobacterium chartae]
MTQTRQTYRYFVERMDCADCARTVENALSRLPGVEDTRVNFNTQTLSVTLDTGQTPTSKLEQTLRSLGYPPTLQEEKKTGLPLKYFVERMDCADCARTVEGALGKLPGVTDTRVNFNTQTLSVTLDTTQTSALTLEQTLRSLGYPPTLQEDKEAKKTQSTPRAPQVWHQTAKGKSVLTTGGLLVLAVLLSLVLPQYAQWAYTLATLIGTYPLAIKAFHAARLGEPFTINTLITVAALGSVLIGESAEGALVVFLFTIGELLEGIAAGKARQGIQALAQLAPKTALLIENGTTRETPVEDLQVGQTVQVQPGGRIPADGTILTGEGSIDDSPVTGESVPVSKGPGDTVFAGSINTESVLTVRVDRSASDNTISRIIHLVEEAETSKAPTARFIDRFSRIYTPLVMLVSLLVAVVPPLLMGGQWHEWLYKGVTLLLIGCPCALVLSVPAAVTSGISAGARRGLLIKGGLALENIGSVKTIAFDKTGTLTENKPQVTDVVALEGSEQDVLLIAAAVEQGSSHPLAKAIVGKAATGNLPEAKDHKAIPGKGVTATVQGVSHQISSPKHAAKTADLSAHQQQIETLEEQGKTVVVLLSENTPLALIAIRDEPRGDAKETIAKLKTLGVKAVMLTGDNSRTGRAIAGSLGMEVQADLLPEDKLRIIREMKKHGKVAMIGDGINDAPALAESDVGIAMGGGTDVALETADAALLGHTVRGVSDLLQLSRQTMGNIKQNVVFALGLKLIFLVTTLMGITGLWPAILSDTGATVLVTLNALRLLKFNPQ